MFFAAQGAVYEEKGVFDKGLVDGLLTKLRSFNDANLRQELANNKTLELVTAYFHCG